MSNDNRQEKLRELDAWLVRFMKNHPVLAWLLPLGIALVIALFVGLFIELVRVIR